MRWVKKQLEVLKDKQNYGDWLTDIISMVIVLGTATILIIVTKGIMT